MSEKLIVKHPFTGEEIFISNNPESRECLIIRRLIDDLNSARFREDARHKEYPFLPEDFDIYPFKDDEGLTMGYQANGGAVVMVRDDADHQRWLLRMQKEPGRYTDLSVYIQNQREAASVLYALGVIPEKDFSSVLMRCEVDADGVKSEDDITVIKQEGNATC